MTLQERYDAEKQTFQQLAQWVKKGCTVERLPIHDAVQLLTECPHDKNGQLRMPLDVVTP